jgi:hypothetical protein
VNYPLAAGGRAAGVAAMAGIGILKGEEFTAEFAWAGRWGLAFSGALCALAIVAARST